MTCEQEFITRLHNHSLGILLIVLIKVEKPTGNCWFIRKAGKAKINTNRNSKRGDRLAIFNSQKIIQISNGSVMYNKKPNQ